MDACEHGGYHSGEGRYAPDTAQLHYVIVCDACGSELRVPSRSTTAPTHGSKWQRRCHRNPGETEAQGRRATNGGAGGRAAPARVRRPGLLVRSQAVRVPDVPRVEHLAGRRRPGHRRRPARPGRAPVVGLPVGRARAGRRAAVPVGPPPRRRRARQPAGVPRRRARLGRRPHAARPRDPVPRGDGHVLAQRRRAPNRGAPQPVARTHGETRPRQARRAARPRRQHAVAGAAAGAGRARRAAAPATVPRGRLARPHLPRRLLRAVRGLVPGAAARPSTSVCSGSRRRPQSRCRSGCSPGLATATTFAIVTYNLFLSTTLFHNNRAYLVIVLGVLAVAPCGRELSVDAWLRRRRGRPPLDPRAPGLAAVAAAVRVRRGLRGVRHEQAPRSRLVRRHGHLACA